MMNASGRRKIKNNPNIGAVHLITPSSLHCIIAPISPIIKPIAAIPARTYKTISQILILYLCSSPNDIITMMLFPDVSI
jgi:hypothetical protein